MTTGISLVISDVDGTLVTPDKRLTAASVRVVHLLHRNGIDFTIASSRPPVGLRTLIERLSLKLPLGAFNGGTIVGPDLGVIERHFVPEAAVRSSLDLLAAHDVDVWLFTIDGWFVRDAGGDYVPREKRTLRVDPTVVADLRAYAHCASKIVGSSKDFGRLVQCEEALRSALGAGASITRSQPYYLDITPPGIDKGTFFDAIANRLKVERSAIAVFGDMENDLPMFRRAGLSIAMGNASADVKRQADRVAAANTEDGFARAIEEYVLAPAGLRPERA